MVEIKGLMKLSAKNAIKECTWESIEFLFKPRTVGELLLRLDYESGKKLIINALTDDSPSAMPFRFRNEYSNQFYRAIEVEEFYRALKLEHEKDPAAKQIEQVKKTLKGRIV